MENWKTRITTCIYVLLLLTLPFTECQECGDNPMKQVLMVAKRTGRPVHHVLHLLRDIDAPAYDTLERKFRLYAACVGLVDTGYFRKRSSWPWTKPQSNMDPGATAAKRADYSSAMEKIESRFEPKGLATMIDNYRRWPKEFQLAWNAFWPMVYNAIHRQQTQQQPRLKREEERDFSTDAVEKDMPVYAGSL